MFSSSPSPAGGGRDARLAIAICAGFAITYSVSVLWYVATFPDVGLRILLPEGAETTPPGVEITEFTNKALRPAPKAGDRLLSINGQPTRSFLDVVDQLDRLRSAKIAPGGQLPPGSDPSELPVPALVEMYNPDPSLPPDRLVELRFLVPDSANPALPMRVYVPVRPVAVMDISLTIVWFVTQLLILSIALARYWNRPHDRISKNFCLMSCASMGAFVAGFHWWILAGSPLLNVPFIVCATLLPALVLKFFLVFPRESPLLTRHRRLVQWSIFAPAASAAMLLVAVYWSAWCLKGDATGPMTAFQKLSVLLHFLGTGHDTIPDPSQTALTLLATLRTLVYATMVVATLCFSATVAQLVLTLFGNHTVQERRQIVTILIAALISTLPIGYTLYLAFFREIDFAMGRGREPMFIASMMFMAAYAHGMLRHRLMLADERTESRFRYTAASLLVSGSFAVCVAVGGVAAHSYSLPLNSTTAQQISLFLILALAAALLLWVRDRLQSAVDRRFFSEKYQLEKTLQQLNRAAGYLTDPAGLSEITLRTCQDIIDASGAAMFVRDSQGVFRLLGARSPHAMPQSLRSEAVPSSDGDMVVRRIPSSNRESMTPLQKLLHELKAELLCYLEDEGGLHGLIVIGRRRGGLPYTAEDIAFVHAIGQMSLLALHSSRANQNMSRLDAELKVKVDRIAEQQRQLALLRAELTHLQKDAGQAPVVSGDDTFDRGTIRGSSPALVSVLGQIRKVSRTNATVLIRGESGTGKELLARIIHQNSDRATKPLVCVNCAALSPSLLESELFGHVRGAFTGAHADKAGRFQAADGGTLFLDEIGDVSLETQVKLLRVLQERCFEPVGSDHSVQVDVRLIAATNRDLEQLISTGKFREDFFYRLNVVAVTLPPLRQRREDLVELLFHFLTRSAQRQKKQIRQIDPEALEALEAHTWPGNIRELENVMERAVVLAESDVITLDDLPVDLQSRRGGGAMVISSKPSSGIPQQPSEGRRLLLPGDSPEERRPVVSFDSLSPAEEEKLLRDTLKAAGFNKAQAARRLNLPRSTFFSKCRKFGIR